jgi:adenylate kinase
VAVIHLAVALKKYDITEEKVLIVISSLMVWNKTPPKMKEIKEGKEGAEGEEGDIPEGGEPPPEKEPEEAKSEHSVHEEEGEDGEEKPVKEERPKTPPKIKKYVHMPYLEEDFAMRVPSSEYEEIKRIEDEILEFKKENVRTFIIASGVQYGKGESIFNSHLKKAWI